VVQSRVRPRNRLAFRARLKKAAARRKSLGQLLRYRTRKTPRRYLVGAPYMFQRRRGPRRKTRRVVCAFILRKPRKLLRLFHSKWRKRRVRKIRRRYCARVLTRRVKQPRRVTNFSTFFNKYNLLAHTARSIRKAQLLSTTAPASPRPIYTLDLQQALIYNNARQLNLVTALRNNRVSRFYPKRRKRRRTRPTAKRIERRKRQIRRRF
jgi:hypothetical protein